MSTEQKPILYSMDFSPPARTVWLTAKYIGLDLDVRNVNFFCREQLTDTFLQVWIPIRWYMYTIVETERTKLILYNYTRQIVNTYEDKKQVTGNTGFRLFIVQNILDSISVSIPISFDGLDLH